MRDAKRENSNASLFFMPQTVHQSFEEVVSELSSASKWLDFDSLDNTCYAPKSQTLVDLRISPSLKRSGYVRMEWKIKRKSMS
jgi:hypothetical protein